MKLVTLVCEAYAQEAVIKLLHEAGAQGYTLFPVQGKGSHGIRPADVPEFANIQIDVIVQPKVADHLLQQLAQVLFPRFGMVAFESDVRVLRRGKF
jgi:nitrogen regulatory protein PII